MTFIYEEQEIKGDEYEGHIQLLEALISIK
jgi:hypothetical protein